MYEVEVKAHLRDRKKVVERLKGRNLKFSEELHPIDHIFIPEGGSFPPPLGTPVLQVREEGDKHLFTLKISQSNRTDSIEKEIEIKDGKMMVEILKLIKWKKTIIVDKIRTKTSIGGVEISLDSVSDLGEFIEAEKIVMNDNSEDRIKLQEELFNVLLELGMPKEDYILDGKYDIMLSEIYNKLGAK